MPACSNQKEKQEKLLSEYMKLAFQVYSEVEKMTCLVTLKLFETIPSVIFFFLDLFSAFLFIKQKIMFYLDGTTSMVGDHNTLRSCLREANLDIILVKCVCHRKILCSKLNS
jgi:hypothetical protein